jgi:hypothetical protein
MLHKVVDDHTISEVHSSAVAARVIRLCVKTNFNCFNLFAPKAWRLSPAVAQAPNSHAGFFGVGRAPTNFLGHCAAGSARAGCRTSCNTAFFQVGKFAQLCAVIEHHPRDQSDNNSERSRVSRDNEADLRRGQHGQPATLACLSRSVRTRHRTITCLPPRPASPRGGRMHPSNARTFSARRRLPSAYRFRRAWRGWCRP